MAPSPATNRLDLLNSGNLVNVSLALYREHFRSYLWVAVQSVLWYAVPLYGWAKASQLQALIARQAYSELIEQPESLAALRQQLRYYTWDFWAIQVLIGLASLAVNFVLSLFGTVLIGLPSALLAALAPNSVAVMVLIQGVQVMLVLCQWAALFWLYCRLMAAEVSLAVESRAHSWSALLRSWQLTQRVNWRVQMAAGSLFLVTIPLLAIAFFVPVLAVAAIAASRPGWFQSPLGPSPAAVAIAFAIFFCLLLFLLLFANAAALPLWQALKAALYFDLLNRREGRNLELRSPSVPAGLSPAELPVPEPPSS